MFITLPRTGNGNVLNSAAAVSRMVLLPADLIPAIPNLPFPLRLRWTVLAPILQKWIHLTLKWTHDRVVSIQDHGSCSAPHWALCVLGLAVLGLTHSRSRGSPIWPWLTARVSLHSVMNARKARHYEGVNCGLFHDLHAVHSWELSSTRSGVFTRCMRFVRSSSSEIILGSLLLCSSVAFSAYVKISPLHRYLILM